MVFDTSLQNKQYSKDWLASSWDNVSEWSDMYTCGLLLQWVSTIKIHLGCLSSTKQTTSHKNVICTHYNIDITLLFDVKQQSITHSLKTGNIWYLENLKQPETYKMNGIDKISWISFVMIKKVNLIISD